MKGKKFSHLLKEKRIAWGLTQEQMSPLLDIKPRMYSYYESGKFDDSDDTAKRSRYIKLLNEITETQVSEILRGTKSFAEATKMQTENITVVTVDSANNEVIKIVNERAKAGYIRGNRDKEFWEDLKTAVLPEGKFSDATTRGFQVEGDSMKPRFNEGDIIYATNVPQEQWVSLREFYVYVIVTNEDIVLKRIRNQIRESKTILCYSDNIEYEPYTLDVKDIKEIWRARRVYSADLGKIPINTTKD